MRYFKSICTCILIVLFSISLFSVSVYATLDEEVSGIDLIELPEDEKNKLISELSLTEIQKDEEQYSKESIVAFDVSDDEMIALGLGDETILICDDQMNIEKALHFKKSFLDASYYLNWEGNTLYLFFNRRPYIFSISEDGEILNVVEYNDRSYETLEYLSSIEDRKATTVNDTIYEIEKSTFTLKYFGGDDHDIFSRVSPEGEKEILFSSQVKTPFLTLFLIGTFIIGFVMFAAMILIPLFVLRKIRKSR